MGYYLGYVICGILVLISILVSVFAQVKVSSTYEKYKNAQSPLNVTGAQLAEVLAKEMGVNITVGSCRGTLSDHYDSRTKTLNISEENYNSTSLAAHAIVAHEFGHALQDKQGYLALKLRYLIISASNMISRLLFPVLLIGLLLDLVFFLNAGMIVIYCYVGVYTLSVIASLVTLPVEFNASARAKKILSEIGFGSEEYARGIDELLNSAAMTYVASLFVSMAFLMRALYFLLAITRDK